jgi:S1-C subfamily serine protease
MRALLLWLVIVAGLAGLYKVIPQDVREEGRRPVPPEATRPAPPATQPPAAAPGPPTLPPATPPELPPEPKSRHPSASGTEPPVTRREPEQGGVAPSLPGYDFIMTVSKDEPRANDGAGSAFALNATGIWLTAAHVVDDCKAVWVLRDGDWRAATAVRMHPTADIAVIRAAETGPTITLGPPGNPAPGADAFHVGYPQLKPAQVHSRYIGRARIERPQRGMPPEPGHVWVEVARAPDFDGSLGGLSGGPAFDRSGRVVGITILESSRRGRVTTAPVDRVLDLMVKIGVQAKPGNSTARFDPATFQQTGDTVRAVGTVTHVFCSWQGNTRPRRRR